MGTATSDFLGGSPQRRNQHPAHGVVARTDSVLPRHSHHCHNSGHKNCGHQGRGGAGLVELALGPINYSRLEYLVSISGFFILSCR